MNMSIRDYSRANQKRNSDNRISGLCLSCRKPSSKVYCDICRIRKRKSDGISQQRASNKAKQKVLKHYGNKCACCGESIKQFLTIDHVRNNGAEHRRKIKSIKGVLFHRWIIANGYPDDLQILCWNCNCGKQVNGGVCPHIYRKPDHEQEVLNLDHRHLWDSDNNLFAECKKCKQGNYIETEIGFIKISDWCPVSDAEYEQRLEKFGLKQARRLVPGTTGNRSEQQNNLPKSGGKITE